MFSAFLASLVASFRSRAALQLEILALGRRHGQPGPPNVPKDVRELIRRLSRENPLWGAPRIHGELLKLDIDVGETSVGKCFVWPHSQRWDSTAVPVAAQVLLLPNLAR